MVMLLEVGAMQVHKLYNNHSDLVFYIVHFFTMWMTAHKLETWQEKSAEIALSFYRSRILISSYIFMLLWNKAEQTAHIFSANDKAMTVKLGDTTPAKNVQKRILIKCFSH